MPVLLWTDITVVTLRFPVCLVFHIDLRHTGESPRDEVANMLGYDTEVSEVELSLSGYYP